MDRKLCSLLLVLFLTIGVASFAQGRGQGHGPAGGLPPAVTSQHGGGDHGPANHGPENKPSEHQNSLNSGRNDVAARLTNTKLASKLQTLLPGVDLATEAMKFKNLGQFVAAVHVSHNLNIPFDQLEAAMLASDHKSLGDAIHQLKPELNTETVKTDAKKAEDEAKDDVKTTS